MAEVLQADSAIYARLKDPESDAKDGRPTVISCFKDLRTPLGVSLARTDTKLTRLKHGNSGQRARLWCRWQMYQAWDGQPRAQLLPCNRSYSRRCTLPEPCAISVPNCMRIAQSLPFPATYPASRSAFSQHSTSVGYEFVDVVVGVMECCL